MRISGLEICKKVDAHQKVCIVKNIRYNIYYSEALAVTSVFAFVSAPSSQSPVSLFQ